jgi:hypothetical protein
VFFLNRFHPLSRRDAGSNHLGRLPSLGVGLPARHHPCRFFLFRQRTGQFFLERLVLSLFFTPPTTFYGRFLHFRFYSGGLDLLPWNHRKLLLKLRGVLFGLGGVGLHRGGFWVRGGAGWATRRF